MAPQPERLSRRSRDNRDKLHSEGTDAEEVEEDHHPEAGRSSYPTRQGSGRAPLPVVGGKASGQRHQPPRSHNNLAAGASKAEAHRGAYRGVHVKVEEDANGATHILDDTSDSEGSSLGDASGDPEDDASEDSSEKEKENRHGQGTQQGRHANGQREAQPLSNGNATRTQKTMLSQNTRDAFIKQEDDGRHAKGGGRGAAPASAAPARTPSEVEHPQGSGGRKGTGGGGARELQALLGSGAFVVAERQRRGASTGSQRGLPESQQQGDVSGDGDDDDDDDDNEGDEGDGEDRQRQRRGQVDDDELRGVSGSQSDESEEGEDDGEEEESEEGEEEDDDNVSHPPSSQPSAKHKGGALRELRQLGLESGLQHTSSGGRRDRGARGRVRGGHNHERALRYPTRDRGRNSGKHRLSKSRGASHQRGGAGLRKRRRGETSDDEDVDGSSGSEGVSSRDDSEDDEREGDMYPPARQGVRHSTRTAAAIAKLRLKGKAQHIDYFHHSSGDRKPKTRVVTVEDVEGSTSSAEEEEEEDKEVVREQILSKLRDRTKLIPLSEQQRRQQQEQERRERERERKRLRLERGHRPAGSLGGGAGNGNYTAAEPRGGIANGGGFHAGLGGGGYRERGSRRGRYSDDDVLDTLDPAAAWRAVQGPQGGAAGMPPWGPPPPSMAPATPIQPGGGTSGGWTGGAAPGSHQHLPHRPGWGEGDLAAGAGGPVLAKEKGTGNAEISAVQVDPSVSFDQVGGLDHYINALKEMVFLPLLYPELFTRFRVNPPRGVLFYGPPGTGKTLVARALAAQASKGAGRRVSFFMRKGADVLSKWVGEAERQLRLLFEEAARCAPSIIFFDEIDGLAPVRSAKQDQIHNSIVSTLLALMDGLDPRGQVVVIGATNRIDSIDGALRRPGRFDRELLFPLPNLKARRAILDIHTSKWADPPSDQLKDELAALAVGYCGADIKALCAEAALHALRRRYPQIYESEQRLVVRPESVRVERQDFLAAASKITPASNRSAAAHSRPLSPVVAPALAQPLASALSQVITTFPAAATCLAAQQEREGSQGPVPLPPSVSAQVQQQLAGTKALASVLAATSSAAGLGGGIGGALAQYSSKMTSFASLVMRPRLLICGPAGSGQEHLAAALLHALEGLPVHALGLPSLLSDPGARSLEEAVVHAVVEARRAAPAILFLPHLHLWWATAPGPLRAVLLMLLADLPPSLPLLLLATADGPRESLDPAVQGLFRPSDSLVLRAPGAEERAALLGPVVREAALPAPPLETAGVGGGTGQGSGQEPLPVDMAAVKACEEEEREAQMLQARQRYEDDAAALRALRMCLREVTLRLLADRRWKSFREPADDDEYWERVSCPCDLATVLARVDGRRYPTTAAYLADVALIVQGWREYYGLPPDGPPPGTAEQQAQAQQGNVAASGGDPVGPPALGEKHTAAAGSRQKHEAGDAPSEIAAGAAEDDEGVDRMDADEAGPSQAQDAVAPVAVNTQPPVAGDAAEEGEQPKAQAAPGNTAGAGAATAGPPPPPREVSKAHALFDEASALVYARVPPDLARRCEAIMAAGGPAPPPPGMVVPEQVAAQVAAQAAAQHAAAMAAAAAAAARARSEEPSNGGGGAGGPGGRATRQRGGAAPVDLLHADPEEIMRRTKALQRQKQQQQKQQVQGSQQQQEGVESEGEGEDMDVVVIETQQEEEGAVATQQEPGGDGGLHADAGHPDEEFHDAAEAGTSDVRVAAGGAGDMEVDPAAGNRPGQQPQEHGTAGGAAPVQPLAPQQPLLSTSQVEPPIRGAPQEPQPDPEALPVCEDLIQQLVAATRGWLLGQLEVLHAQAARAVAGVVHVQDRVAAAKQVRDELLAAVQAD